ncbi:hypothetical protein TUM12129_50900 (plasmid) [Klebsiella pneumoniae]|jgi:hypothetical protein|nr:hypothetical protein TUM12129_50900 [Klebsiella pneumoniae]
MSPGLNGGPAYRFLVNLNQTLYQSGITGQGTVRFLRYGWPLSVAGFGKHVFWLTAK